MRVELEDVRALVVGHFDRQVAELESREHYYRCDYTDSRGRFHPCPASARQCAEEAERLRNQRDHLLANLSAAFGLPLGAS